MKRSPILFLCLAVCLLGGCIRPPAPSATEASKQINYSEQTVASIQTLADGNIAAFYQLFDDNLKKELSQQELQTLWNDLISQYGAFQYYQSDITITSKDNNQIASVPCVFANGTVTFQLTFNAEGLISGFYTVEESYMSESTRLKNDTEISFGTDAYPLSGSLTLPEGTGPFPVVILVSGYGAQDRNEQLGPNLPFLNLAEQLSSQGIAVLRYDKRSYTYARELAQKENFTVYEETIDDVAAAVSFLKTLNTIQSDRIYIAGHCLSGYLMPRIAEVTPDAAGYIFLAASARPLEDILLDETVYILNTESNLDKAGKEKILTQVQTMSDNVKNLTGDSSLSSEELFDFPVSYWLSLQNYAPLEEIKQVDKPLLFLHGGRDYQVPASEMDLWKEALSGKNNAQFLYYDNLNHLFMSGTGKSTPTEFQQKGTVNTQVSEDLAAFIHRH